MAVVMRGHATQGDELLGVDEVDVEKTANGILARRELHLSKEALLERQAYHLTKHFLKMGEERTQERSRAEAEQSRKHYEKINQRAQEASEAQELLDQMVREQKLQIQQLIRDKGAQRREQERQAREDRSEREKWVQARMVYDKMEYERRMKEKADRSRELQERLQEKSARQEEAARLAAKQAEDEKKTQLQMRVDREEKKAQEAANRRRQQAMEARERASNISSRTEQAEQRRQQLADEALKSARESKERREQKVKELKQRADCAMQERNKRIIEKHSVDRHHIGSEESLQGDSTSRSQRNERPQHLEESDSRQGGGSPGGDDFGSKNQEAKGGPTPSIYYYCTPRVGKDLIDANVRVQKEYVRRCHDLEKEKHDMLTQKHFKSLAEAAKTLGDKFEGGYTRKMRSLHRMYINPKTREDKSPGESISPRAGGASGSGASASATPRTQLGHKMKRCGLCEREYPMESLEGRALRRTVEKFKQQQFPARDGRGTHAREALVPSSDVVKKVSSMAEVTESEMARSERGPEGLYDYEVRLCASCWSYMRVAHI